MWAIIGYTRFLVNGIYRIYIIDMENVKCWSAKIYSDAPAQLLYIFSPDVQ